MRIHVTAKKLSCVWLYCLLYLQPYTHPDFAAHLARHIRANQARAHTLTCLFTHAGDQWGEPPEPSTLSLNILVKLELFGRELVW